jgi:hypothetical protein
LLILSRFYSKPPSQPFPTPKKLPKLSNG